MKTKISIMIFAIVFISGCYTIIKHPETAEVDEKGNAYYSSVDVQDDCGKCHNQSQSDYTYDYDKYNNYYNAGRVLNDNPYYESRNNWVSYYQIPWWFTPPMVTQGSGSQKINDNNINRTTGSRGSKTDIRTTGSTRTDVNISAPSATRNSTSWAGSTTTTPAKTGENKTPERGSNRDQSNTNSDTNNSSGKTVQDRPSTNNNNTSDDNKRNTGSTRRK